MRRLTPFGKMTRGIRIEFEELLRQMAAKLGISPSFLSAVEGGKKKPHQALLDSIVEKYKISGEQLKKLKIAFRVAVGKLTLEPARTDDLGLAELLAERFNRLSDSQKTALRALLSQGSKYARGGAGSVPAMQTEMA